MNALAKTSRSVFKSAAAHMPVPFGLLSADSTDAYLRAVRGIPILSADEEQRLALRVRDEHDAEAAKALILANLRFVVHVARGYLGYGLPFGDLIQEGNVGLMKAIKRFDPSVGVRLVAFAVYWIRAEIHEFIFRNWRVVRTGTSKAQRKLFFNLNRFRKGAGWMSRAEAQHVAAELKVPVDEVLEMESRMAYHDLAIGGSSESASAGSLPEDVLADEQDPASAIEQAQWTEHYSAEARRALCKLDPRSRDIIQKRFLRGDKGASLEELAADHKVSVERIRQIQVKALRQLREQVEQSEALAA